VSLQSGVGLPGNEPPLDFIEKDREDQAENRDVRRADIRGVDPQNMPLNHRADAVIGATISEDCNQDEAGPDRELYSRHDRRQRSSGEAIRDPVETVTVF
jgi:hypothetical protein